MEDTKNMPSPVKGFDEAFEDGIFVSGDEIPIELVEQLMKQYFCGDV